MNGYRDWTFDYYKRMYREHTPGAPKMTDSDLRLWWGGGWSPDEAARRTIETRKRYHLPIETYRENPITTKDVLLSVAALGAIGAVFYAVNASAKSTAPTPTGSAPANALQIDPSQSGTTISVALGQQVVISVPNADPGYTWKIGNSGDSVMSGPAGASSATTMSETYTVTGAGIQTITFTQLDLSNNINPNNGEYTFTFTTSSPTGGAAPGGGLVNNPGGNENEV